MNTEELFINAYDLPNPLTKIEFMNLFVKFKNGDLNALDEIVRHNIKLVISRVLTRFKSVSCDKKELVSSGCLGLLYAIDNFDLAKNVEFSTYAVLCIDSKIVNYLRSLKKFNNIDSLDKMVLSKSGPRRLLDVIPDGSDLLEDFIKQDRNMIIKDLVNKLPKREQEMIIMFFGFGDGVPYKQKEIAEKFNVTQAYVSILITRTIHQIADELVLLGLIEKNSVKSKKR